MIFKTQDKTITTFQGIEKYTKRKKKGHSSFQGSWLAKNQVIKTGAFNKLKRTNKESNKNDKYCRKKDN